jgi:alpha-2-macroglobulin
MSVNWLTGIKGSGLKAETTLSLSQVKTTFDGYANFHFDDMTKRFDSNEGIVFSGTTNEEGLANFSYQLPRVDKSAGALKATFDTKAFEPGGDFSINTKSVLYFPYQSFVGIKLPEGDSRGFLQTDKPQRIDAVVLSADGKPVSRNNLQLKIYKLDWRWWWDQSEDYSLTYLNSNYSTPVISKVFDAPGGKGNTTFQINKPEWGRYLAIITDPNSGHSTSQTFFIDWPGWAMDAKDGFGAAMLQVSTDKAEYKTGETVEVTIPGSANGKALVTLENGSRVVEHFWIQTNAGKTNFSFKASADMAPNIYLNVTLIQPHAQSGNDLPIRMYGIVPIKIYDPGTVLTPVVSMAKELAPGKEVTIQVKEQTGQAMAYTLAVVDEGLLDITNFKTPDPWNHFYSREAIGVKTWDIYDDVIGAYGGRLERLLAIGGDGEEFEDEDKKNDNRFKPVVRFMGPFFLEKGKSKTHTFTMPQYIGSVKTMVVAANQGAYGKGEQVTPVIQPLMVLGTLPRVTGPGEKIRLPVNLFRYVDNIRNAEVTVKAEGIIKLAGGGNQQVSISGQTTTTFFDLQVDNALGRGKVTITAKSGSHVSTHEINLESRAPNPPQTRVVSAAIAPGKSYTANVDLFGMSGTNEAVLELATVPNMNLEKRLSYLIQYPHGCIEQTTSSVFPQLYLDRVVKLSPEQKITVEENIKAGIKRLSTFQLPNGAFAYWPGSSQSNDWGTNYGYHFLLEAQKRGYVVPGDMMNKLKKYQDNQAKAWTKNATQYNDDLIQAYRLFTLALSGDPATGSMNRMMNLKNLSVQSNWKLAAAYAHIGQGSVARDLLARAGTKPDVYDYSYTYGSATRDLAMLLETYVYLGDKTEGFKVFKQVADLLAKDEWMSTQTTAYCLLAVGKFLGEQGQSNQMKASVNFAGKATHWETTLPVMRESLNAESSNKSLTITNNGQGTLYLTVTTKGTPLPGNEVASSSGMEVTIQYRDANGMSVDPSSMKQGKSFQAVVKVTNRNPAGRLKDVALSHIFPSGWEIENERLNADPYSGASTDLAYQDIRDDRVYSYFDLNRGESKTIIVKLTATYAGRYYMPGVSAEAMYDAGTNGRTEGKWVEVVE